MAKNLPVCTGNSGSRFSFQLSVLCSKSIPVEQYRFSRFHNSIEIRYACLHSTNFFQQTYWGHLESMLYCYCPQNFQSCMACKIQNLVQTLTFGYKKLSIRQYLISCRMLSGQLDHRTMAMPPLDKEVGQLVLDIGQQYWKESLPGAIFIDSVF